jgi:hypothetical protein
MSREILLDAGASHINREYLNSDITVTSDHSLFTKNIISKISETFGPPEQSYHLTTSGFWLVGEMIASVRLKSHNFHPGQSGFFNYWGCPR